MIFLSMTVNTDDIHTKLNVGLTVHSKVIHIPGRFSFKVLCYLFFYFLTYILLLTEDNIYNLVQPSLT